MSRGSYKRYEYDHTVSVPKTTSYNKRKRQNYEKPSEAEYFSNTDDNSECLVVSNIVISYSIVTFCFIPICYKLHEFKF